MFKHTDESQNKLKIHAMKCSLMRYSVINPKWNNHVPFDGRFSWNRARIYPKNKKKHTNFFSFCFYRSVCSVVRLRAQQTKWYEKYRDQMMKHCNKNLKNIILCALLTVSFLSFSLAVLSHLKWLIECRSRVNRQAINIIMPSKWIIHYFCVTVLFLLCLRSL